MHILVSFGSICKLVGDNRHYLTGPSPIFHMHFDISYTLLLHTTSTLLTWLLACLDGMERHPS